MSAPATTAIAEFDEVLNVAEAAALLGVGKYALYGLVGKNAIPHRRVGKHLRFSRAALLRWLEGDRPSSEASR